MAENRKPKLAPEEGPHGVDRWTSNGYGLTIGGKKVTPPAEDEEKDTADSAESPTEEDFSPRTVAEKDKMLSAFRQAGTLLTEYVHPIGSKVSF